MKGDFNIKILKVILEFIEIKICEGYIKDVEVEQWTSNLIRDLHCLRHTQQPTDLNDCVHFLDAIHHMLNDFFR